MVLCHPQFDRGFERFIDATVKSVTISHYEVNCNEKASISGSACHPKKPHAGFEFRNKGRVLFKVIRVEASSDRESSGIGPIHPSLSLQRIRKSHGS